MLFNSIAYFIFLPIVVLLFYVIPHKYRWALLLGASYYFYMSWRPEYALLIIFVTLVNYILGKKIYNSDSSKKRKVYLWLSIISCLSVLVVFKYDKFIGETLQSVFQLFGVGFTIPALDVILPVGISFYTFQTLSYTIDVYNKKKAVENHFGIFSLYVSFFPQLVAGPIERSTRLLPQFYQKHTFDYQQFRHGLQLILIGLFKKMVVADRLAIYVDQVFGSPQNYDGLTFIVATVFFSFQVYCDFAGYTDIAIGSAKILGFDLMQNFKRPFLAQSLTELWRRWHISLSTWFRDYLYIPLGGNRVHLSKWCWNIVFVFTLCGLWHGADWTFVLWGTIHGVGLVVERLLSSIKTFGRVIDFNRKTKHVFSIFATFLYFNIALMIFRPNNISDAIYIINKTFTHWGELYIGSPAVFIYSLFGILCVIALDVKQEWFDDKIKLFHNKHMIIRQFSYASIVILILMLGVFDEGQFIYFQF
ncbi:MAG: MBOAT family protein [Deltaproteobacteria bacterium]|jgi:alginate O-acetyltransferase complex protein AlgI|nr:MBOAT family protein [Deltaproteobacteria bacterium]